MSRSASIDGIKAVASQLIVLHHLALYAPMSATLSDAWPQVTAFVAEHGRLAVQPFLVLGGWHAALSLQRLGAASWPRLVLQRYLRLAPALAVALVLVMAATAAFHDVLQGQDWLSPLPGAGGLIAHLLLLQDVLGIPSISAGAWYVAIDLQCFALLALLTCWQLRAARSAADAPAAALVALATIASIVLFSRDAALDVWAIYFLSAYGLGVLAAWSLGDGPARRWMALTVLVLVLDLIMQPRPRPLLALGTALALLAISTPARSCSSTGSKGFLGRISYGVFVGHFTVIIVVSALWTMAEASGVAMAFAFTLLAWAAAIALGWAIQALAGLVGQWRA